MQTRDDTADDPRTDQERKRDQGDFQTPIQPPLNTSMKHEWLLRWLDSFLSDPHWLWEIGIPPRKGKIERLLDHFGITTPQLFWRAKRRFP